jgi:galactose-1-phosphate uridylyltransferase
MIAPMAIALESLFEDLRRLPEDKQMVAASVIHALRIEAESEEALHPEWKEELRRRAREIAEDAAEMVSEEEVYAHVQQALENARQAS